MSEFFTPSKPKVQLISLMNTQRLPEVLTTPRALDTPARQPFTARGEYKISAFEIVRPTCHRCQQLLMCPICDRVSLSQRLETKQGSRASTEAAYIPRPKERVASALGRPCDVRYGRQDLEQQLVGTVQQVERQVLDKVKHSIRALAQNGCSAEEILWLLMQC